MLDPGNGLARGENKSAGQAVVGGALLWVVMAPCLFVHQVWQRGMENQTILMPGGSGHSVRTRATTWPSLDMCDEAKALLLLRIEHSYRRCCWP